MNRRSFMTLLGAAIVPPELPKTGAMLGSNTETVQPPQRPAPIDLGHGILLIDYRPFYFTPQNRLIGELRNTTGRMIDSPVVSLYYPLDGRERAGFAYATALLPVIEAGGTVPVFGTIPDETAPETVLATADFALCTSAEPGQYTQRQQQLDLTIEVINEEFGDGVYLCQGEVINSGDRATTNTMVLGIVRDSERRIIGITHKYILGPIDVGQSSPFSVWAGGGLSHKANPFLVLLGSDYTVEIVARIPGPVVLPGCSFGRPWE